jgi:hypothetical protein
MECEFCNVYSDTNCPYLAIKDDLLSTIYESPELHIRPDSFYIEGTLLEAWTGDLLLFDFDISTYEFTSYFCYQVQQQVLKNIIIKVNEMVHNSVFALTFSPVTCLAAHDIEVWTPTQ